MTADQDDQPCEAADRQLERMLDDKSRRLHRGRKLTTEERHRENAMTTDDLAKLRAHLADPENVVSRATVVALVDEVERLREALRPFAQVADSRYPSYPSDYWWVSVMFGDCRRAREALG